MVFLKISFKPIKKSESFYNHIAYVMIHPTRAHSHTLHLYVKYLSKLFLLFQLIMSVLYPPFLKMNQQVQQRFLLHCMTMTPEQMKIYLFVKENIWKYWMIHRWVTQYIIIRYLRHLLYDEWVCVIILLIYENPRQIASIINKQTIEWEYIYIFQIVFTSLHLLTLFRIILHYIPSSQ